MRKPWARNRAEMERAHTGEPAWALLAGCAKSWLLDLKRLNMARLLRIAFRANRSQNQSATNQSTKHSKCCHYFLPPHTFSGPAPAGAKSQPCAHKSTPTRARVQTLFIACVPFLRQAPPKAKPQIGADQPGHEIKEGRRKHSSCDGLEQSHRRTQDLPSHQLRRRQNSDQAHRPQALTCLRPSAVFELNC